MGSSIRLDVYGNKVVRILPVSNPFINEDWITNKARFCYDALDIERLLTPLLKIKSESEENRYIKASWSYILKIIKNEFERRIYKVTNNILDLSFLDIESLIAWKDLIHELGMPVGKNYGNEIIDKRENFLLNPTINELEKVSNALCIGVELLPLIKFRLRKGKLIYVGCNNQKKTVGHKIVMKRIANGISPFCKTLLKTSYLLIFGLEEMKEIALYKMIEKKSYGKLSLLQGKAGFAGALDIGIPFSMEVNGNDYSWSYIIGAEEPTKYKGFSIFQGNYGGTPIWNVMLPTKNIVEKKGKYVNIEGAYGEAKKIVASGIHTRLDADILKAIGIILSDKRKNYKKTVLNIEKKIEYSTPILLYNKFFKLVYDIKKDIETKKTRINIVNKELADENNNNILLKRSRILTSCNIENYKVHHTYA